MTTTYSTEAQLLQNTPRDVPNAAYSGGSLHRSRNIINLASQLAADIVKCAPLPIGMVFAFGKINASATLGSTTLSIGYSGSTAAYRADATFTAAVATTFGLSPEVDNDPSTSTIEPLVTFATATAPSSGVLVVDFYYSMVG